jgi:hypothetical protein
LAHLFIGPGLYRASRKPHQPILKMASIKKPQAPGKQEGHSLIYYFNPGIAPREVDGEQYVYWEDLLSKVMEADLFEKNYRRTEFNNDLSAQEEYEASWEAGYVQVSSGVALRFLRGDDPVILAAKEEYEKAPEAEKSSVCIPMHKLGFDPARAAEVERDEMAAKLAALEAENAKLKAKNKD